MTGPKPHNRNVTSDISDISEEQLQRIKRYRAIPEERQQRDCGVIASSSLTKHRKI